MPKTTQFILSAAILVAALGVGYYNVRSLPSGGTTATNGDIIPNATDSISKERGITEETLGEETLTTPSFGYGQQTDIVLDTQSQKPSGESSWGSAPEVSVPVPDFNRPPLFSADIKEEEKEQAANEIENLADTLRSDSNHFNAWKELGLLLKSIGDYEGARQAWEYASAIRPEQSLTFANLGVLYGYYLHEPLKAEANLLHAIENEPRFLDLYARMTDFYLEVAKSKEKALGFLDRSIAKYPDWEDIKTLRGYVVAQ